jgi:hypothetical protein
MGEVEEWIDGLMEYEVPRTKNQEQMTNDKLPMAQCTNESMNKFSS